MHREFWMDLTASSAVNLPMSNASLRLVVMWMGAGSTRCTYAGAALPWLTLTTNLMFVMTLLFAPSEEQTGGEISRLPSE